MEVIRHRIGINAPIEDVYEAIATREGTATWWTRDVRPGDARDQLEFWFGGADRSAVMQLEELSPPDRVVWRVTEGPEEWVGAPITFDLHKEGDETVLLFTHGGWAEPVEFMFHCSSAWGYYLLSLKASLEGRTATPFPDNMLISSWG